MDQLQRLLVSYEKQLRADVFTVSDALSHHMATETRDASVLAKICLVNYVITGLFMIRYALLMIIKNLLHARNC